jgi:opacity protein-like surface antigen
MSPGLRLAAVAALTLTFVSPISAADLLPPLPSMDAPLLEQQPLGAGWYLRGDLGYAPTRHGRAAHTNFPGRNILTSAKIDNAFTLGAGLGYRYNSFLRVDLTLDHRFASRFSASGANVSGPATLYRDRADFSATTGLVNAYLDLGTWDGVTPYIGGGVGLSNKRFSNYTIETCAQPCGAFTRTGTLPGKSRNDFAWALMAGLAIGAGDGATVDLGYRYLNLGEARTGSDPLLGSVRVRKIESHEFRVGLRWEFDSSARGY